MKARQRRSAVAAVSAALFLAWSLTACGSGRPDGVGDVSASKLGFARHANAVQWPADDDYVPAGEGLRLLAPLGDCALGVGTYRNGYRDVTANWRGDASCTRLSIDPAVGSGPDDRPDGPPSQTGGWNGGGVTADAVVPWTDGSLLAIGADVVRRAADGRYQDLADLHLPTPTGDYHRETADQGQVDSAVRAGSRLLIGGGEYLNQVETPFLMTSDDGGATVRRITLPWPAGGQPAVPFGPMGTSGHEVAAVGEVATNAFDRSASGTLPFWHSDDDGAHWTATVVHGTPPGTQLSGVFHAGGRWFAVGGYVSGKKQADRPLIYTSADGSAWTRADTSAMGAGAIMAATLNAGGRPVLIGRTTVPRSSPDENQTFCGNVWVGDGSATGWKRGELDCDQAPAQAVVTLSDGRVLIAGNRTLWISGRPGKAGARQSAGKAAPRQSPGRAGARRSTSGG